MASAKLTTTIRTKIVNRILSHRFGGEIAALIADRAAFAQRCYEDVYDASARRKMDALPRGWLPTDDDITLSFAGSVDRVQFSGAIYGELNGLAPERTDALRLPVASTHLHNVAQVYEAGEQRAIEHALLVTRRQNLTQAVVDARRQVEAVVNTATTTGKLREIWPESAAFLEDFEDVKLSLPAVPVKTLNEMLDLPVAGEKVAA